MHWVLGLVGMLLGAIAGGIDKVFLGLVAGALLGWQGARIAQLHRRLEELQRNDTLAARMQSVEARAAASAMQPDNTRAVSQPASATPPATTAFDTPATSAPAPVTAAKPPPLAAATPQPAAARATAAAPAPRVAIRARREPDLADRVFRTLKRWLFEGNVPVKLGMLVLFFSVAAALKYASDQGYFSAPIEVRLAGIAAAALAGLVWGWRNRQSRPAFGLSLQGGAIGALLLTVFAAYRLYALLPSTAAFVMVLVLVAGAAMLALLQNTVWLAVLGFLGGYLAPVLISTGSGNHVALFTYYALLNAAVFGIAWKRPWRALNLIGFGFTFGVGLLWGQKYYQPQHFATVEPFLILFFLFYVAIAVLYALRSPDERRPLVDGTLIFGTPLIAFPMQAAMLADDRMGLAYSALAMALLYALLAAWLLRRRATPLLGQSFAALAIGFATLAVPLAFSARWTCASWALEGAALAWVGVRQQRWLPQLAGWALQALAAMAYFASVFDHNGWGPETGEWALLNGHALSVGLMALAAFFLSWWYERNGGHRLLVWTGFMLGTGWWTLAALREGFEHFDQVNGQLVLVAIAAISASLAALLRGLLSWPRLGWIVVGVALLGVPLALATIEDVQSALQLPTAWYWLAWFAAMLFGLMRLREPEQRGISLAHVAMLFTAALLYGASLRQLGIDQSLANGWRFVAAWVPMLLLLFATWRMPAIGAWPLADRFDRYSGRWFAPACVVLAIGWLASLFEPGGSAPLPFIPLLNPLELFQLGLLLVTVSFVRQRAPNDPSRLLLAIALFAFISLAGLRGVHQFAGVSWNEQILDDRMAQATLTVLWSMLGVAAWIYGSRRRLWNVWLAGAILMGVVLIKLVGVDRHYLGNIAGIISFMAVGGLLVLVGRIAPTPPRHRDDSDEPATSEQTA